MNTLNKIFKLFFPLRFIFAIVLFVGLFSFAFSADAASIRISGNVQGYRWCVGGPISDCRSNDLYTGQGIPSGTYTIGLQSAPGGYHLVALNGSTNPDVAGNIDWQFVFEVDSPPPVTLTLTVNATGNVTDGVNTCPSNTT